MQAWACECHARLGGQAEHENKHSKRQHAADEQSDSVLAFNVLSTVMLRLGIPRLVDGGAGLCAGFASCAVLVLTSVLDVLDALGLERASGWKILPVR